MVELSSHARAAYDTICKNYQDGIIYPPFLFSSETTDALPYTCFFVKYEDGGGNAAYDAVLADSESFEIKGVLSVNSMPESLKNITITDMEATLDSYYKILISVIERGFENTRYPAYVAKYFTTQATEYILALCAQTYQVIRSGKVTLLERMEEFKFSKKENKVMIVLPDWFHEIPEAMAYAKALEMGVATKMFHAFCFKGNSEMYDSCLKDFTKLLYSYGLVNSDRYNVKNMDSPTVINADKIENLKEGMLSKQAFYVFSNEHMLRGHAFVFDISKVSPVNALASRLLTTLGFTGDTVEVASWLKKKNYKKYDFDQIFSNTMMAHLMNGSSPILAEQDFAWMDEYREEHRSDDAKTDSTVSMEIIEDNTDKASESVLTDSSTKTFVTEFSKPVESVKPVDTEQTDMQVTDIVEDVVNDNTDVLASGTQSDSITTETERSDDDAKEPEVTGDEERNAIRKKNIEINDSIRKKYEDVISFLRHDSNSYQWRDIVAFFRKAMENDNYSTVVCKDACKLYLVASKDTKTSVYAKLYHTMEEVATLMKEFKPLTIRVSCLKCDSSWDVDVSAESNETTLCECPKCAAKMRTYVK